MELGKELARVGAGNVFGVAGLLLGVYSNIAAAPPTQEEMETLLKTLCVAVNEMESSNTVSCNSSALEEISKVFPDIGKSPLYLGGSLWVFGTALQVGYLCFRHYQDGGTTQHDDSTVLGQAKHFMHRTVDTMANTLVTVSGVFLGGVVPNLIAPTPSLPPDQQMLNAMCVFSQGSNMIRECDLSKLASIAILFAQPSEIPLWIGGGVIGALLGFVLIHSLYKCLAVNVSEGAALTISPAAVDGESDVLISLESGSGSRTDSPSDGNSPRT